MLRKIFAIRVQLAKKRRLESECKSIKEGRFKSKNSSKLFRISAMQMASGVSKDPAVWSASIADDFDSRWSQGSNLDLELFEMLGGRGALNLQIDPEEIATAYKQCSKKNKLDTLGLCTKALAGPICLHAHVGTLISQLVSSPSALRDLTLVGVAKGKKRGVIGATDTRGIFPQLALLQLAHRVFMNRWKPAMDNWSQEHNLRGLVLGAGPGGQTRDMIFTISQVLEKGRDRLNNSCVCLGDIRKCHDELPWGSILQGSIRRGIDKNDVVALLRLHVLPTRVLAVGSLLTRALRVERGALTGAASASFLARVIVEDSLSMSRPSFRNAFSVHSDFSLDAMAWSDNLAAIGNTLEDACHNFSVWRQNLLDYFHLAIKPDSLIALPARTRLAGSRTVVLNGLCWEVSDCVRVLGSWVSGTGEDRTERLHVMNMLTRAFWSHAKVLTNSVAPVRSRMRLWRQICYSVCDYYLAGIRPVAKNIDGIVSHVNKLSRFVCPVKLINDESKDEYVIRRNKEIARVKADVKFCIRTRYCNKLVSWVMHLHRHKDLPSFLILQCQNDEWLRARRERIGRFGKSRSIDAGETRTRQHSGYPLRWATGWYEALAFQGHGWENSNRDKELITTVAQLLYSVVWKPSGRLALEA